MAPTPKSKISQPPQLIVTLKLSSSLLSQFAPRDTGSTSSRATTPANDKDETLLLKPELSQDQASEANGTPQPGQDASTPGEGGKKRKGAGAASRKSLNSNLDTMPKPRGKPGPKKKPRLEDGTIDHGAAKPLPNLAPGHKLNPKANTGAINANLRALDRSGAPCRKWDKKPFTLKSFTGITWELSSWKGGETVTLANGPNSSSESENKDVSMRSSSDVKPGGSDVAMSNTGDQPDPNSFSTPAASSPLPIPASHPVAALG